MRGPSVDLTQRGGLASPVSPPPVSVVQPRFTLPNPVRGLAWDPLSVPTVEVEDFAQLQAAVSAATFAAITIICKPGDYSGNLVVPANTLEMGDGYITIMCEGYASLPWTGHRVKRPAVNLVELHGLTSNPTIEILAGAAQLRFYGFKITSAAPTLSNAVLVGRSTALTSQELIPRDIHFQHCWVTGATDQGLRTGVSANCDHFSFRDGIIEECHQADSESHAMEGFHCNGPQLWENNEASAYSVLGLFGAGPDEFEIVGLQMQDVTVRHNLLTRPLAWQSATPWDTTPLDPPATPAPGVNDFLMKNFIESKGVVRMLVEENVLENCWQGNQPGLAFNIKSTNQYNQSDWIVSQDITIRRNIVLDVWYGLQIAGAGSTPNNVTNRTNRIHVYDNSFAVGTPGTPAAYRIYDDVSDPDGGRFLNLAGHANDIAVENNTHNSNASHLANMGSDGLDGPLFERFTYRNNVGAVGTYGYKADGLASGDASVSARMPNADIGENVFLGDPLITGGNNTELVELADVGYLGPADYRLPDDSPYLGKGCNGVTLNAIEIAVREGVM